MSDSPSSTPAKKLVVTFARKSDPARTHVASFDLGDDRENSLMALRHAWTHGCSIAEVTP